MVAHIFCDLNDLFIGTQQGIRSLLHPVIVQVVFKGLSVLFPEKLTQISTVDIIFLTQAFQCNI